MSNRLSTRSRMRGTVRHSMIRALVLIGVDGIAWLTALAVSTAARWEFEYARIDSGGLLTVAAIAITAQAIWGLAVGLYPGKWRLGSFAEAGYVGVGAAVIGGGVFGWLIGMGGARPVPLSVSIVGPGLFVLLALGPRFAVRMVREQREVSRHVRSKRALFFGAGEAGHAASRALSRDPLSVIEPVAFLDDDPANLRLRIGPSRVVGDRKQIARAANTFRADTLVITMPSAPRAEIAAISKSAREAGLEVLILPRIARFLDEGVDSNLIRPIEFGDFLGRDPVNLDHDAMARFIEGRKVLITGAGGSIGSALCAAVQRLEPASLVKLDRDENALHSVQLNLEGRALLDSHELVVADIRDSTRLQEVFGQHQPEVVFHAAALKHVTLLEQYPGEAVKTNVFGTANLLRIAESAGVKRFINISTDKAADPVSVLGMTKRIGEMLTAAAAGSNMTAVSVRFGNVLGSSGSVLPTLRRQILDGGPLTVTHPEVTRFFMTIEEAVQLILQAGAVGREGQVLVLDMGEPVSIVEMARELIAEVDPGSDAEIIYTGLRPGEKLHEVLAGPYEQLTRRPHEGIISYSVPPVTLAAIEQLDPDNSELLRERLEKMTVTTPPVHVPRADRTGR